MENILIIIQKLKGGGAERAAANLSKDLSQNYNVKIVVFDGSDVAYPYEGELVDLKLPPGKNFIEKVILFVRRLIKIKSIKKKYNISCSISFLEGANLLNVLTKKQEVVITSQRNMMSKSIKSSLSKTILKYTADKSDFIVTLSEGVKLDIEENFSVNRKKVMTIYNSCNKEWFMKSSLEIDNIIAELDSNSKYIINVGRLHTQKGQWNLIKAFYIVQKKNPTVKLIILGTGELEIPLKQLCSNLNIADKVIFLGYLKNYHKLLERCEVFVFSSLYEGLGNALLEAMACGLPVISTDCYFGPREILAPDTDVLEKCANIEMGKYGLLVPEIVSIDIDETDVVIKEEHRKMAKAIELVLNDENIKNYYKNASIVRINDFSPEIIKQQWIELIENLIRNIK